MGEYNSLKQKKGFVNQDHYDSNITSPQPKWGA